MDETSTPTPEPVTEPVADQPSSTPSTDSSEKLLPQSEVNRLIANARREGRESAQKTAKPTAAPAPQSASTPAPVSDPLAAMQSRLEEMELRLQYAPSAAKAGWDDTQSATMFDLFKAQRPQDSTEWFSRMEQMFPGSRKQATPSPATPAVQTQAAAPAAKPNISDRGSAAPTDTRDHNGVLHSRPLEMTGHDVEALILQHGHDKGLQTFQEHVLRALGNVRIKPPRG